jgi:hypothetical protein
MGRAGAEATREGSDRSPWSIGFFLTIVAFAVYWWGSTSLYFQHGDARVIHSMLNEGFHSGQLYGSLARDFRSALGLWSAPSLLITDFPTLLAMIPDGRTHEATFGAVSNLSLFVAGYALARSFACNPTTCSFAGVGLSFVTFLPSPLMWSRVPLQGNYILAIAGISIAFSVIITHLRVPSAANRLRRDIAAVVVLIIALGSYSYFSLVILPSWLILGASLFLASRGNTYKLGPSTVRWSAGLGLIALVSASIYKFIGNSASISSRQYAQGPALDLADKRPWFFDDVYPILIPGTSLKVYGLLISLSVVGLSLLLSVLEESSAKLLGRTSLASASFTIIYSLIHYGGIVRGTELGPSPGYVALFLFPLWIVTIVRGGEMAFRLTHFHCRSARSQSSRNPTSPTHTRRNVTLTSLMIISLLLWLVVWIADNADLRNSPSFYPVRASEISNSIRSRQLQFGTESFSGRAMLLQREDSERDDRSNVLLYPTPFTKRFRDELVELRVPVLNAYSHQLTARFVEATSRWFADGRPFVRQWASFESFDPKLARMLGVRYLVTESDMFVDGDLKLLNRNVSTSVFEITEPNLGQYSPVRSVAESSITDVVGFMKSSEFDPQLVAVTSEPVQNLVLAESVALMANRGLITVRVKTNGRSLLVLPFEFTECMQLVDAGGIATLDRVNFLLTGLTVEKSGTFLIRANINPFLWGRCN